MEKETLLKKFKEFMESIEKNQKIAILHHRDADGLCAAVLFSKALERLRGKGADSVFSMEYLEFKRILEELEEIKPDKIVSLDLSLDQQRERIENLEKIAPLLLLDHHKIYNDLNSKRTLFVKSQMLSELDGSKYPASKLVFDLCSKVVDLSEEKWIACVGLLGDMGYEQWKGFFKKTIEENSVPLKKLRELKELIGAVETIAPNKFGQLFEEFHTKNPQALLNTPLNKYKQELKNALKRWRANFEKNAEFFPGRELYFYVFKPSSELKSALIDSLTFKHPNKTLIIAQDLGGEKVRFSARRQDFRVKMNELLEKAVKGIPNASAGGHIPAAAGSVPRDYLNVFKENLLQILKEGKW